MLTLGWFAPFFSNSGYGSEAISYLLAFQKYLPTQKYQLTVRQFAEPEDHHWASQNLPTDLRRQLRGLQQKSFFELPKLHKSDLQKEQHLESAAAAAVERRATTAATAAASSTSAVGHLNVNTPAGAPTLLHTGDGGSTQTQEKPSLVAICHSTPDVWHADGAFGWGAMQTRCPPESARMKIGRTMYETDTLPNSWVPRLEKMDFILVPTKFHYDIWKRKVKEYKLRVLPECVDTDLFSPNPTPLVPGLGHRGQHRLLAKYKGRLVRTVGIAENKGPPGGAGEGAERELADNLDIQNGAKIQSSSDSRRTAARVDPKTGRLTQTVKKAVPSKYKRGKAGRGALHEHEQKRLQQRRYFDDDYAGDQEEAVFDSGLSPTVENGGEVAAGRFSRVANPESAQNNQPVFFLAIGKWEKRKGFDVLIRAFQQEFGSEPDVYLLIKTSLFHNTRTQILKEAFGENYNAAAMEKIQHIIIDDTPLNVAELVQLYREATAVVLPSRGEGWGRGHVEAMSMAKPLIATNWSGPTAFMRDGNSLAVNYTLTRRHNRDDLTRRNDVHHESLREAEEGHWAEPQVQSLRQQMRWVVHHPEEAREIGMRGRKTMVEHYSLSVVAKQFDKLITELWKDVRERDAALPVGWTAGGGREEL